MHSILIFFLFLVPSKFDQEMKWEEKLDINYIVQEIIQFFHRLNRNAKKRLTKKTVSILCTKKLVNITFDDSKIFLHFFDIFSGSFDLTAKSIQ